jgi:1,4-alpha-glucan branching enzyme
LFSSSMESPARVELVDAECEFFVLITEHDETVTKAFVERHYADAYAEGQRIRLGLDEIVKI